MSNLGFIIPSHCTNQDHVEAFKRCIRGIRQFYPTNEIVIIDDFSPIPIANIIPDDGNIILKKSDYRGAGEMLPYLFLYSHKYFTTAVIIHDSVEMLKSPPDLLNIETVKFIKRFTSHIRCWSISPEPPTEYNIKNNIKTHDDLILHLVNKFNDSPSFIKFFNDIYWKKTEWIGCFGVMSVTNLKFLIELQERTRILDMIPYITDRRRRCAMETVFSIACQFILGAIPDSYSLYYDGYAHLQHGDDYFLKQVFSR